MRKEELEQGGLGARIVQSAPNFFGPILNLKSEIWNHIEGVPVKLAAEIAGRALTFLITAVIGHRLGAARLGDFQYAWSIGWILALTCDLGLNMHLVGEVARDPVNHRRILGRALILKLALALPALLLLALFSRPVVFLLSATVVTSMLIDAVAARSRGLGKISRDALFGFFGRFVAFVGGGIALAFSDRLTLVAAAMLLSQLALLVSLLTLSRPTFGIDDWLPTLRESLPIGIASAAAMVYLRVDLLMIYNMAGPTVAGHYAAAARIYESFGVIPAAVMAATYPAMVREDAQAARRAILLLLRVAAVAIAGLGIFAGPALRLLFGFDEAAMALRILAVSLIPTFVNSVLMHELLAHRKQKYNALINLGALFANILFNGMLIPRFGADGAAVAWLLTEAAIGCAAVAALTTRVREHRVNSAQATAEVFP